MKFAFFFLFSISFGFAQNQTEVFFEFDHYDLEPSQQQKLDSWIVQNPKAEVTGIYGYCDRIGTLEYNDSLSVKRAETVKEYLKSSEMAFADDFELKGYGENFLQSKTRSENRKVAVRYALETDSQTINPRPKSELQKTMEKAVVGEKIRLPNLNFFNMSDQIVPKSRAVLGELLEIMKSNPKLKVEIQGHICCQTVKERDYSYVSTIRAKAVYNYLVRNGIEPERLSYKGYGVSRPLHPIPEKNEKEQDENRRVEVEILGN
ncbi:OmpA family protein [Flavobacterium sp. MAH-1]|uniref:OmpA family protein n=1 Tax=Flavobacterium agri TaxID=2743471 RepID=A0A7Y8Y789_9FLAO|nr:OmpA family protein [Flavobacterium agri]NUY82446.1 OmpA family protein [Flavobacterium agri]NYA72470.1 OmpA family protein [Flavobacterium agri]